MDYEFWNFFVNCCVAVGTIGTVVVALYLARPKKERASGSFKFLNTISDYSTLELQINNIGNTDIRIDDKPGAIIKLKDKNESIFFNDDKHKILFIPKTKIRTFDILTSNTNAKNIQEMYKDNNCIILIYTVEGTEIELKKK